MAAAKTLLCRKTLLCLPPQLRSFSASAVPFNHHLRQPNHADADAHLLSLIPADVALLPPKSKSNPIPILKFLNSSGVDDAHIARFVAKRPKVLFSDLHKNLAPKFHLFQSLGMSPAEVVGVLERTQLLQRGLDTHLIPRIDFLRSILHSDEDVAKVIKKTGWSLSASHSTCNRMKSIISICKDLGFTDDFIRKLILNNPQHFQLRPELVRQAIGRVKTELGVEYKSHYAYFYALVTLCHLDTLAVASKLDIFKKFGWSMDDISTLVRFKPDCLMVKDMKLNMGLKFLIETAGLSPSYIARRPTLLTMSIERRVIPRYNALNALKLKNLISEKRDCYWAILMSEELFLKTYISRFEQQAPDVCKAYLSSTKLDKSK